MVTHLHLSDISVMFATAGLSITWAEAIDLKSEICRAQIRGYRSTSPPLVYI